MIEMHKAEEPGGTCGKVVKGALCRWECGSGELGSHKVS